MTDDTHDNDQLEQANYHVHAALQHLDGLAETTLGTDLCNAGLTVIGTYLDHRSSSERDHGEKP